MKPSIFQTLRATFGALDPLYMKRQELRHAQLAILEAHTAKEYAEAMVDYHQRRIDRLTVDIKQDEQGFVKSKEVEWGVAT